MSWRNNCTREPYYDKNPNNQSSFAPWFCIYPKRGGLIIIVCAEGPSSEMEQVDIVAIPLE